MRFFDLVNISERYMELLNPSTPEKSVIFGQYLRLREGSRAIDFGCGYAEALVLWAEHFGSTGIGIEVREHACERARHKIAEKGLSDRIGIVCANAAEYPFEEQAFDVATCIGASFIWGGYRPAICAMRRAIHKDGRVGIGEPYWLHDSIPPEYAAQNASIHSEYELLQIARQEGFDLEYVVRASHDDWDGYESDNWYGLIRWIEENPKHPELEEVVQHLHKMQEDYLNYGRQYLGWAMYVLTPQLYQHADHA